MIEPHKYMPYASGRCMVCFREGKNYSPFARIHQVDRFPVSQTEPHKFVPWDDEPELCFGHGFYGCGKPKDDPIHQQESQPEPHKLLMELKWQHDNTSDHTDRAIIDCKMEQLIADEAPEGGNNAND